jgi:hypothetical protein
LIDENSLSSATRMELHNLRAFELLVKYNWRDLVDIIDKHCSLGTGVLAATSTSHDIDDVLKELKIPDVLIVVAEIKFALDPVNYGNEMSCHCGDD